MPKVRMTIKADENGPSLDRPGTEGRYHFVYFARTEADARQRLAVDEALLGQGDLRAVTAYWTPPAGRWRAKGRLDVEFDSMSDKAWKL